LNLRVVFTRWSESGSVELRAGPVRQRWQRSRHAMGFRFRRVIPLVPGLIYLNLSKSGVSFSFGKRGAMVNVGHGKQTVSVGVPGTGMGYRAQVTPTLIGILVAIAVVIGVAYFLFPDLVRPILHHWQPSIF
jgi:hypothetical protein